MPDVNSVKLGGLVCGVRKWKTSAGKPALTLRLVYGSNDGEIDVLVFGDAAKKAAKVGRKNTRVVVHGRLNEYGEIMANNVVPVG